MPQQSAYEKLQDIGRDTASSIKDAFTLKAQREKASKWFDDKVAGAKQYINSKTTVAAKEDPKSQTRKVTTAKTAAATRKPVAKKTARKTTTKR